MNAVELIITGNVQRVGYRNIVSQAAFEFGINGYVENLPNESVRIVVQGNGRKIKEFINKIRIKKWPINVENIKQIKIPVKTPFRRFAILRGKPTKEMAERADEAALYMHKMYDEMHGFREETGKNLKQLEGTLGGKTDYLRKETSRNFEKLEKGLGSLGNKTDAFRKETSDNFNKLDGKYGSVSSSLKSINGGIKRIDGNIKHIGANIKENNKLLSKIAKRF